MTIGHNTIDGRRLLAHVERIEALEKDKKAVGDDIKVVFAEARKDGFTAKALRLVIKARKMTPSEFREGEGLRDMYLHAVGLAGEPPLFKYLGSVSRDGLGRAKLIETFKDLVPNGASITVEMGGPPVRLFRDGDGGVHEEEVKPAPAPAARETIPKPPAEPVPDTDEDGAEALGREAAKANRPIIANPFPFGDKRRGRWDLGWRKETGNDGMGPDEDD